MSDASQAMTGLSLPCGLTFTVQRPPLGVWLAAGKMPLYFARLLAADPSGGAADFGLSEEETANATNFLRAAIISACVSPRLTDGATSDADALDLSELAAADFDALAEWILCGSPGIPVVTKWGGVSLESLTATVTRSDGADLLLTALTAHQFHQRPSEIVGILDAAVALAYDHAASLRLQQWMDQRERSLRLHTAAALWGASDSNDATKWESP